MNNDNPQSEHEASIFGDSQPDASNPQVVTAEEHAQHPFFTGVSSRGRGGGGGCTSKGRGKGRRGKGGGSGSGGNGGGGDTNAAAVNNTSLIVPDTEDRPLFGPISLKELESAHRRNADGAESQMWSEDEADERVNKKKRRKKRQTPSSSSSGIRVRTNKSDEDCIAAATFGGAAAGEESEEDEDDDDEDDECEPCYGDGDRSETVESSIDGKAARLLPIRGETCVGCICERGVIDIIDRFVRQNAVSMTETALYKAAAIHYRNEIVLPRKKEGVRVLNWNWKDMQAHYVLHVCDPLLQRAAAVRSLGAVRAVQEQQLMRHNSDGTKQLDHKGCEMLLKIVALQVNLILILFTIHDLFPLKLVRLLRASQDKQIQALDAARMPPPTMRGGAAR